MRVRWLERLSPEENMRRDLENLLSVERGDTPNRWRVYSWDRLCLSIGYSQKAPDDLPLPVVRRPTGGGALLHGWDVSFSLVDLRERWGSRPTQIYRRFAELLISLFGSFGVRVRMERHRGGYAESFYCFFVPTFGELIWEGRKAVALAMRTLRRAFLIHGSVYVDFDPQTASELTGVPPGRFRERIVTLREMGLGEEFLLGLRDLPHTLTQACPGR